MAKTIITKTMVQERIVQNLAKGKVYVKRLGKRIIPTCIGDLPPRMRRASVKGVGNQEYKKAHSQLYYELVTKPGRAIQSTKVIKESILVKATTTPVNKAVSNYKDIAKGKVKTINPARKGKEIVTFNFDTMSIHINGKTQTISVDFI